MPEQSSYRVVVAGAGFGGIGMAAALRQAGIAAAEFDERRAAPSARRT
jgi:cation diffusion facilitator CzcD-associated flavoprotein CzcO